MTPGSERPNDLDSLRQQTIVVVDVETTGLSPRQGDRVCEVAAIRREYGQPESVFQALVDPERAISPGAYAVNGITPAMLTGAPRFSDILDRLDTFLRDAVFVAHNARFDLGFLQSEFERCGRTLDVIGVLDTRLLAKRFLRLPSNNLASVARYFHVPQPNAHRALADCHTTLAVLDAIVAMVGNAADMSESPVAESAVSRVNTDSIDTLPDDLADLLRREETIEIIYLTAQRSRCRRVIRDAHIVKANGQIYLNAICTLRDDMLSFRLDQIVEWRPVAVDESETSRTMTENDRAN